MGYPKNFSKLILWLILAVALALRLYSITAHDVITDESVLAFRSIGYIDFFASPHQTTPYDWFSQVPAWAKLSFHDHPPLTFLIQHFSFWLFGENVLALRLPFVLAGVISVYLIYLIAKEMVDKKSGLFAAALLAVSSYHTWISRIGLQESLVIVFSLLSFYGFLRAINDKKHWQWAAPLALAILVKYTAAILLVVFLLYLFIYQRQQFRRKQFWLALALAFFILSPIFIYNLKLYSARGHFDLQIAYLLGQQVEEWSYLPGKIQAGSFGDRIVNLPLNYLKGLMWPLVILLLIGVVTAFVKLKTKLKQSPNFILLALALICYSASFLVTGPAMRFVAVTVPFWILFIVFTINLMPRKFSLGLVGVILALEGFITVNTLLLPYPVGAKYVTYSYVKSDHYHWGYHELTSYVDSLLKGSYPAFSFPPKYEFIAKLQQASLAKAENDGKAPKKFLLIYDPKIYNLAALWTFHRHQVYHGWPIVSSDAYLEQGEKFFKDQSIEAFYFFKIADEEILIEVDESESAAVLAQDHANDKISEIQSPNGNITFDVYRWE